MIQSLVPLHQDNNCEFLVYPYQDTELVIFKTLFQVA